jgi:signal transduction histidine kinase
VRRRLVIAIAGVATAAVLLLAVPLAIVLERSYRDEALLRLQRDTIAATRAIDLGAHARDPVELPHGSDTLAVYGSDGRRIAGGGPAAADAVVRDALRTGQATDRAADGRLTVAVPLLSNERVAGAVRADRSDAAAVADAHQAWLTLLAAAAVIVALAAGAALVLARRLALPLERLAGAATRLGEGDFAARAPRAGVPEVDAVGEALDSTAERLDALLARERAFSADASHQLRTPLAALRIELEAIELRGGAPPELARALAQVERLQSTIDVLLAVARDDPHREARTDVAELADAAERRWHGTLAADARPLRVVVSAADATARASRGVLEQALEVLLANAAHHGRGAVTLTVREAGASLAVDVTDEGEGFEGDPEAAFSRRAGTGDGHGIGLALARSLVQAEGGRLLVTRASPHPRLTVLLER